MEEIKLLFGPFLERLPSYAMSHTYDVVAYELGLLVCVIVSMIKDPIKKFNKKKAGENIKAYRRRNLAVAAVAFALSEILFQVFAYFSPTIEALTWWTLIAGLTPIAIYTILELIMSGLIGQLICIAVIVSAFFVNRYYCAVNMNHHKICYAVKMLMIAFGMLGIVLQFFCFKKGKKTEEEKI